MKTAIVPFLLAGLLSACAMISPPETVGQRPMAFHDSRLQYALLTDHRAVLEKDFAMTSETSPVERVLAGALLPFSVATETVFWPLLAALSAYPDLGAPSAGKVRR